MALNDLATQQAQPTEQTHTLLQHLLDYASTHPSASVTYSNSNMILQVHSDASYLSVPKARSRAGGYFFMGYNTINQTSNNGPIHCESKIIKNVMTSAPEAEIAAIYLNAKIALAFRITLHDMGHPQPPIPIQTDNNVASGFINNSIKQKRTKTIDMNFHWLQDMQHSTINVYWKPKALNLGDYLTKHHSPTHHRHMRPIILNHDSTI